MGKSLRENSVPRTATDEGGAWRAGASQSELFAPSRPSWRDWVRWLLHGEYKSIGVRCFGGDPEQARIAMVKILEKRNHRRFDIEWLDYIAEELGPDGEEAIVRFVCDRYGFQPAVRKPSPQREEERIANLEKTLGDVALAVKDAASELSELRLAREGKR